MQIIRPNKIDTQAFPEFSLWQSSEWKKFQEQIGHHTYYIGVEENNALLASCLIISRPLIMGKKWIEIPRGPLWKKGRTDALEKLFDEIKSIGKKEHAAYIRFSPPFQPLPQTQKLQSIKAHNDHHPETSLLINLTLSENEILNQMKPKGRYNIRLAIKKGVLVQESKNAKEFHKLLIETTKRDKFSSHNTSYYQKMIDALGNNGKLYLAKYNGKTIAGGIFTFIGNTTIYYYGASGNEHRNVMAPYLIQWIAIQEAKKRGLQYYDFLGIAPPGKEKGHAWEGVTSFKKKFGGTMKTYPEAQEIILRPFWYRCFRILKKIKHILPL